MRTIVLFCLLACTAACGQTVSHTYNNVWFRLSVGDKISEKLRWDLLIQNRRQAEHHSFHLFEKEQLQNYWLWFHYSLSKRLRLSFSPVCYFVAKPLFDLKDKPSQEWRWSVRAEHFIKAGPVQVQNRPSLEYRYRYSALRNTYMGNFRARYMLKLVTPVLTVRNRQLSLVALDEVFYQFGGQLEPARWSFDQNRVYGGLSYEIVKNMKVDIGYCYTYQLRPISRDLDIQNSLWVSLAFDDVFAVFKRKTVPLQ